jgi:hypothetical protein
MSDSETLQWTQYRMILTISEEEDLQIYNYNNKMQLNNY